MKTMRDAGGVRHGLGLMPGGAVRRRHGHEVSPAVHGRLSCRPSPSWWSDRRRLWQQGAARRKRRRQRACGSERPWRGLARLGTPGKKHAARAVGRQGRRFDSILCVQGGQRKPVQPRASATLVASDGSGT